MAIAIAAGSDSQVDTELVAGVPGKRVQITRVLFSAIIVGKMTLNSIVAGDDDNPILGWVRVGNTQVTDLTLGPEFAVATELGAGLSYSAELGEFSAEHQITVWYELVP